jgi:hypothetical protein
MQKRRKDQIFALIFALSRSRAAVPTPPLGRYIPFLEISRAVRSISCFVATTSAAAV